MASADETVASEPRMLDNYSSSSLTGSVASASSGFGSLPKSKRTPLLSSGMLLITICLSSGLVETSLLLYNC